MNSNNNGLNGLSRRQLYSLICGLKRENNCLKTDLIRFKLLSNRLQKYSQLFDEMNDKNELNSKFRQTINEFNVLSEKFCLISLNELKGNEFKDLEDMATNDVFTQTDETNVDELSGEEYIDSSEEVIIPEIIDETIDPNVMTTKVSLKPLKTLIVKKVLNKSSEKITSNIETNEEFVRNITIKDITKGNEDSNEDKTIDKSMQNSLRPKIAIKKIIIIKGKELKDKTIDKKRIKPNTYQCCHCPQVFPSIEVFAEHIESHKMKSRNSYSGCAATTVQKTMTSHSKTSFSFKPKQCIRCDYEGCNVRKAYKYEMERHKLVHCKDRPHTCHVNDCNKMFKSLTHLKQHKLHSHPEGRPDRPWIPCPRDGCPFKTKSISRLHNHTLHHAIPIVVCDVCGKNVKGVTNHRLACHPELCADMPWFECTYDGCRYRTKLKTTLTNHLKKHTKLLCDICGKTLESELKLTMHKKTVHFGDHEWKIRCEWPECERRFQNRTALRYHMNAHTGQQSYPCPHCDRVCVTKISLSAHIRKHKSMACTVRGCVYDTICAEKLIAHLERHETDPQFSECLPKRKRRKELKRLFESESDSQK